MADSVKLEDAIRAVRVPVRGPVSSAIPALPRVLNGIHIDVTLTLRTPTIDEVQVPFRVDTGTTTSTIPYEIVRERRLDPYDSNHFVTLRDAGGTARQAYLFNADFSINGVANDGAPATAWFGYYRPESTPSGNDNVLRSTHSKFASKVIDSILSWRRHPQGEPKPDDTAMFERAIKQQAEDQRVKRGLLSWHDLVANFHVSIVDDSYIEMRPRSTE